MLKWHVFFASISRISPTNMNIKQSSSSRLLPLEFENDFSRFRFCSTIPARLFFGRACSVENLGGLVLWSLMVKGGATSRIMPHTKGKQQSLATRQQKEPVKWKLRHAKNEESGRIRERQRRNWSACRVNGRLCTLNKHHCQCVDVAPNTCCISKQYQIATYDSIWPVVYLMCSQLPLFDEDNWEIRNNSDHYRHSHEIENPREGGHVFTKSDIKWFCQCHV